MKFKENSILYYINPFVFIIEKVKVSMAVKEQTGIYYIDKTGAYLKEEDLFETLNEAKQYAFQKLDEFYYKKRMEISNSKPQLDKGL